MTPQTAQQNSDDTQSLILALNNGIREDIRALSEKIDTIISAGAAVDKRLNTVETKVATIERITWGLGATLAGTVWAHVKEIIKL